MLRLSRRILSAAIPLNSTDIAFQYPRMQLSTHLIDMNVPELKDCKALYREDPSQNVLRCLSLLQRGQDIFNNIPNWEKNEGMCNVVRSIIASRVQLVSTPSPVTSRKIRVAEYVLRETTAVIQNDLAWTRSDVNQLDISCFILGKFVESFCLVNPRRQPGSIDADRLITDKGQKALLTTAMSRLDELLKVANVAAETHGHEHKSVLWLPVRLTVLKAILTIPLDGNLNRSQELILDAAKTLEAWGKRKHVLHDLQQDPHIGLLFLLNAEISSRIFNWCQYPKEIVDEKVMFNFQQACEFYSNKFTTPTEEDGIMKLDAESRSTYTKQQTQSEDFIMREAYTTCLLSYGNFMLSNPRTNPKETIFPKGEVFTRNAILSVASGSDIIFDDCHRASPMSIAQSRKHCQAAFDRALKLNRLLHPDYKNNEKAGWLLLSMACGFGDLRDYLYATGLFSNATNVFRERYGDASDEMLYLLRLEERMLNGMGSSKEAETRRNKITSLLEERKTLMS